MPFVPTLVNPTADTTAAHVDSSDADTYLRAGNEAIIAAYQRSLRWLQRLKGQPVDAQKDAIRQFIKKLGTVELISAAHYRDYQELLDDVYPAAGHQRGGREKRFYLVVHTVSGLGQPRSYGFDVMATNPTDAYVALSKRSSYRLLTDISLVRVFSGSADDVEGQFPVRTFATSDLIYV